MQLINTEEIVENEITYVVNTYDNGTIEKYIKPDPNYVPEPAPDPEPVVTNDVLLERIENVEEGILDIMEGQVDTFELLLTGGM